MLHKPAVTQVPIADLIAHRWSPRAMDPTKPVSREHLLALLEAARWAPSCYGDQPWRYLVWDRFSDPAGWQQAFECLVPGNQVWVKNAALLLLGIAATEFSFNGKPNRFGPYDTGAASENLCLQAIALDLAVHQMSGYDEGEAKRRFNVPDDQLCMAMIAVGHPALPDILPEELRQKEVGPRQRKLLNDFVFSGSWGQAFKA